MKLSRIFRVALLPALLSTTIIAAPRRTDLNLVASFLTPSVRPVASEMCSAAEYYSKYEAPATVDPSSEVGIKEVIPDEFRDRYQKWKSEMLSTGLGREQWDFYANNKHFLLKIVVSPDKKFGAGTGDYKWDDSGKL